MRPMDYFRLFVFCLWLLDRDVNCENVQKGYVLRVQAGQAPAGVHSDDRDHKRWSEPPIFRIPAASGRVYPAREDHTTDSEPSRVQSRFPVSPETQNKNVPVIPLKSGVGSAARRRSSVVYNRSGNKVFPFPEDKKIHQRNSNSAFSTGAVQVPPSVYHTRTMQTGGASPVQVHKASVGFAPHRKPHVGEYQPVYAFPKSFNPDRANTLQKVLKPTKTDTIVRGRSPASSSAGQVDTHMSYPLWSPRVYNGDVMSEARGYAHTRRIKPALEKPQPQGSSAAGRKFLESGFPSVIQNQGGDSTKAGFGLNHNSRGSQPGSWQPASPDRAQASVQGKFKPFDRLPAHDGLPAHNRSHHETAPTQTSAGTTPPPSPNSTGITSSAAPSVTGELSTESASPVQTEGQDVEPQPSDREGQSETSADAPFPEQNKPVTASPPTLEPAEEDGNGEKDV
ncbi:oxidoreductase HTATIP2 isoform X1 [Chaetodon trifascialis]|uniref:oxidoreductase HTATIP2 isoform X1 n=1 Tax=Chaetodon trifascialis TaxID=109706 RepID=UPI0039943221